MSVLKQVIVVVVLSLATCVSLRADTPIAFEETWAGSASETTTVTTVDVVNAVADDLYVVAVATKPHRVVEGVDGLGLTWTAVATRCAGRKQTGVDVWIGQGTPDADGSVTATYASTARTAVITVTRYSGVAIGNPIGATIAGNTNGLWAACTGGVDSGGYAFDLIPQTSDSVVVSAVAHRHRSHTPGSGFTSRVGIAEGGGGDVASVSVSDLDVETDPVFVDGAFSNDVDWAVIAIELRPTGDVGGGPEGIWTSADELAQKPTSGPAWTKVYAAASGSLGTPDISDFDSNHDVRTLAVALVYARIGDSFFRQKAADAIMNAIGTENGTTQVVQVGRNTVCYVIAADLIDLASYDPADDAEFRDWLDTLRYVEYQDGSVIEEDEDRCNNHGRMCGATRAAIAVYLDDQVELDRAALIFRGFLGDRNAYADFHWPFSLSWQSDEDHPVGINPAGATRNGFNVDGALPEEMRRGCVFQVPPCPTGYPWEALQGALVEAVILSRAGYGVFEWEDQALLRAIQYLDWLDQSYPNAQWWARGDDTWVPWLVNDIFGTNFHTDPANIGKCMGWSDWVYGPDLSPLGPGAGGGLGPAGGAATGTTGGP